jgi:subtilisin family serine protease
MTSGEFNLKKISVKKPLAKPSKRIKYDSSFLGFSPVKGDGKFVRMVIIDSGKPTHESLLCDDYKSINFTNSPNVNDINGHSTAVAGIIAANGSGGIRGFVPDADIWFAKCLSDNEGKGDFDSIIKAIFWSIVKEVDIIVMAFGSSIEHPGLRDAVKKAHKLGICIFAAAGDCSNKTRDANYPARFDEVFSVGYSRNINNNQVIISNNNTKGIIIPNITFETTFLDKNFLNNFYSIHWSLFRINKIILLFYLSFFQYLIFLDLIFLQLLKA